MGEAERGYTGRHAREFLAVGDEFDVVLAGTEDSLPGAALADTDTPAAAVTDVDGSSSEARTPASSGVAKNTALMSVATLGSRVTGLLRTWVMAFALGNTLITSA